MTQQRIAIDPAILCGKPVVRGTRLAVESLPEVRAEGQTPDPILADHPQPAADDPRAAVCDAAGYSK